MQRNHPSRQGPIFSLTAYRFSHLSCFHSLQVILWPSSLIQWVTNTEPHKQADWLLPSFSPEPRDVWQRDCSTGQISISPPTGLGMCVLKLPPTRNQDVNSWSCSKNTISHISALLFWAAVLPCHMVISRNVASWKSLSERHWKTNYKHKVPLSEIFRFHLTFSAKDQYF